MNNITSSIIFGLLVAFGMIGAGYQVSTTIYKAKLMSNTVTVKGFSERDVKADLALWTIGFSVTSDDINAASEKLNSDATIVSEYLVKNGIKINDIKTGSIQVVDSLTNQYREKVIEKDSRYIVSGSVMVHSNDIELVEKSSQEIGNLVKKGVVIGSSSGNLRYEFTKLGDVKPEMLREATKNARNAAEQFALDAGSKVGSIQSATQGFFSVVERDSALRGEGGEGGYSPTSSIDKKVRVVTTITYYLDK